MSGKKGESTAIFSKQVAVDNLLNAESNGMTIPPLSERFDFNVAQAYAVQNELIQRKLTADPQNRWKGLKAGLTSREKQKMVGIEEPILGQLLYSNLVDGHRLSMEGLNQPRVEPEIGFYVRSEIDALRQNPSEIRKCLAWAFPALEILDSRYPEYRFSIQDVIADNASTGRVVSGGRCFEANWEGLPNQGVSLFVNGEIVESGTASAVLGHPLESVFWLADMWARLGKTIPAGSILLTGGITTAVSISIGDSVWARFENWGDVYFACT